MIGVLITEDEVKRIRDSAITLDLRGADIKVPISHPIRLGSGYRVAMTVDLMPYMSPVEHISIRNMRGDIDPADLEVLAKAILGSGYKVVGSAHRRDVVHVIKAENKRDADMVLSMYKSIRERMGIE